MPEEIVGRILRLPGYRVYAVHFDEERSCATVWVRQVAADPLHTCGGCGIGTRRTFGSPTERVLRDLPWGAWEIRLAVESHRVECRRCGVKTERWEFADGKHPYTRRFAEAVARDCGDAAVSRVAAKWGLAPSTVRRIDKRYLQAWAVRRRRPPLRHLGVDELFWQNGKCLTIVSDLDAGEPIWAGAERRKETLDRFFREELSFRRRHGIRAVCVDMWEPFILSIRQHLPQAAIVFDKFHVMHHVNNAVDETRRQEFFRQKGPLRTALRGKRWLFLTKRKNLSRQRRGELEQALSLNRRLFKAYYLADRIEHLWSYTYEGAALRFFTGWLRSIRWQRLPAFKTLTRMLSRHLDGILSYCRHKVPFGVVEAINGNIRSIIRRGRGYRDAEYLILKTRWATVQARRSKAA